MVDIRIIVEGGAPTYSSDVSTANNSESLRQSLNSFFCRLLGREDIRIIVGFGYRNAAKLFVEDKSYNYLFVDSDTPKAQIKGWFEKLKTENKNKPIVIPLERQNDVFFMIQEMEAWFLKQPECFEMWAKIEGYEKSDFSDIQKHSLIRNKNIEDITKPSKITELIMKHFFYKKINGGNKKHAKYGKLKTAPILLDCLDVSLLEKQDSELHRFKEKIS